MTKPGYKQSELGEIPEEWITKPLTEVGQYINGMAFKPSEWRDQGIPIVRIENLNNVDAKFNYYQGEFNHKYLLDNGEILLSWSASLGVYIWNRGKALLNQHIFKVIPNENVTKQFLYWALHKAVESLGQSTHGSTMKHFKKGELERTLLAVPSLPEQQKIAEILTTADRKIELIDKEIQATERLKKGLMQTLLTRGIGHTKFKMTEIGEIPNEWDMTELGKLCTLLRNGLTSKQGTEGLPISRIETISDGKISNKYGFVKGLNSQQLSEYSLKLGDILLSHINSVEHIGKTAIYEGLPEVLLHGMNLLLLRLDSSRADPLFYIQYFKHSVVRDRIRSLAKKAVNQASTNQKELSKLLFPIPPLPEQQKIAEILKSSDRNIELLRSKMKSAEDLKKGLMQVLLTGKVRVTVATLDGVN